MRRLIIGVALVGLGAVGANAQDYIFTMFSTYTDKHLAKPPCWLLGPASMQVYDRSAWIVYTCGSDGHVVLRRYINPGDDDRDATPVYTVPNPAAAALPQGVQPDEACHVPGMVTGIYGGCVPKDHPNAPQ